MRNCYLDKLSQERGCDGAAEGKGAIAWGSYADKGIDAYVVSGVRGSPIDVLISLGDLTEFKKSFPMQGTLRSLLAATALVRRHRLPAVRQHLSRAPADVQNTLP